MASAEQIPQFIKLCKRATDNDTEVLELVRKRFSKADKSFLASHAFTEALWTTANDIKKDMQNKFVHLKKFLSLLKANDGKKRKKNEHESDSSEPTAKRQKKARSSEYSDGSESGPGGSEKHKTEEKGKKKQVMQIESDSDTEPLTTTTDETKQSPKCEKKLKSEENAKKKQIESDSDTEPLSITKNETKEFPKSEKKPKSESPATKELKSESPAKDYTDNQQLTILPLTPVKRSSPEKPDACVPTSYKSPTARYKYCHVAELRLTDNDDDKSSKTSVKKNSDDNIITHIPRKKVARIILKPLTPDKLTNGKIILGNDRTPKHGVQGDRSPRPAAAVTSPGPEYVFVSLDQEQQVMVCEEGNKAADDGDCEILSDVASIPDLDDKDAVDPPEEDEEEAVEERREQEEEEDGPAPVKGSRKQLKKLEVLLDKISGEIRKLENRELTLDDLEDDNSAYAMEDRYKKKFCKVWDKYCEVAGRPPTTGRPTERKFRFEGTRYPEVNKKIERFVNVKQVFPDYHDIRDIIGKVNKKYHLRLRPTAVDNLARDAFTVVGNELQKRRMLDFSTDFESRLDEPIRPYSDPALFDRGLREKLEKNKKTYKSRMSEVLEKYARKQDDGDNAEDMDEEEEEEEEEAAAPSEDEAESDIEKMFALPITSLVKIKAAAESELVPSTSRGGYDGVSPEGGVKTPVESHTPTEQDNFMSAFGLQVRPRQKKSPPPVDKEVDLEDKQSIPQVSTDVDIDKKDKQSVPQVSTDVDINKKDKQNVPQVSTDVDIDKKDKQSIPQVPADVDYDNKDKQSIPQVYTNVDIGKKDKQSVPQVSTDVDIDDKGKQSILQAYKEVDLDEKDTKSPLQIDNDVDLDEEDEKSAPQVYKELDIDEEMEIDQNSDDDEENQRQVYKELDIDEEMDMDNESDDDEESQRQVYKELDIDEELDMDDESDDDEDNQRQVYKELDIDEKSEGDRADGSQDLFEDSDDNDVHYEEMENSQSPRIVPYEENSGSSFLYIEPDDEGPKSSNDTECGNSSSTEVFPGALTYIDVADEDSPDVNIVGSIRQEDVEEVISSDPVQLFDDPESKLSLSRRESIESLGSVHEYRAGNRARTCGVKQGGKENEQSDSDEQIYVERGTLSQPINIEDSQGSDTNADKEDKQKDPLKTPDHSVNVGDRGKENGGKVSDYRKNRLKLPKHKTASTCIDSQTVETGAGITTKGTTRDKVFELGTVTFVDCSSDEEEAPIKTKAPELKPDQSVQAKVSSSSSKNTDIHPPKEMSSNETRTANTSDKVRLKPGSVTYTSLETTPVKGPEKGSPAEKNVAEAENRYRMEKTETPKKSQTPERKIKVPEKGSPTEPIDVDENEHEDKTHDTPGKGSESQPINLDSACSMDVDDVALSATGTKNPKGDIKTTTPPKNHRHSSSNNAVRSSPEAAAQSSMPTGELKKAFGEAERSERNKSTQQSKQTQKRAESSAKSSGTKSDNSSDIIEIDDDSLVGSPEKIPAKHSTAAATARVQRPVSQPPVPSPKVQRPVSQPPVAAAKVQRPSSHPPVPTPKVQRPSTHPPVPTPKAQRPLSQPPVPTPKAQRPSSQPPVAAPKVQRPLSQPPVPTPKVQRPLSQPPVAAAKVQRPLSQPPVAAAKVQRPSSQPPVAAAKVQRPSTQPPVAAAKVQRPSTQPPVAAAKVQRPSTQPPVAAAKVQRPSTQPPVAAPKAQTVDLTSPQSKKKFDPKATINIMNKVLAQSNANVPAVFTQTIADMINKVSAEVFSENANDGKKQNKAVVGNQTGQSVGNKRQNMGAPAINRAPGGVNRTPGGANRSPGGVNRALGGVNRSPGGVNRALGGVNRAPGGANRAPVFSRAPVPNHAPVSPSQSDSRRRLNTNRVLPKSFQTNQAALMQSPGQQKIAASRNGVPFYAPANPRPQPNTGNPSTTGTLPNQQGIAGPQLNAATAGSTENPRPLLLIQNTANATQARSNAQQNPRPNQSVFNTTGGNQRQVVGNQRQIVGNQRQMVSNQRQVVGNQRQLVGNQRQVVGNQKQLVGNQRQLVGNQRQLVGNQKQVGGRLKPVSPRSATAGRFAQSNSQSYTLNHKGVVISPRSNRPVSASSMTMGQRPNGAANNNKHLSPKRLFYPGAAPSRQVVSGQGRGRPSEVDFQQSLRHKAVTSTPRASRSPNQIAVGEEGGLKIMSYSSLATGMTVPVQSAQQKRPASRPPTTTGNVSRGQEGAKKPKIETVVLSDSDD